MTLSANARFISAEEACELLPGMTVGLLAQLRFRGNGPRYYKPTPRKVLYRESDLLEWLDASARTGTSQVAA